MSFFAELKRRNVFRVGIAYAVAAWLLLQIADLMIDNIGAPDWVFRTLLMVLAIGFPITLIMAWAFELTPEGLMRDADVDRSQSMAPKTGRKLDRIIIGMLVLVAAYFIWEARFKTDEPSAADDIVIAQEVSLPEVSPAPEPDQPALDRNAIAVLPFANRSLREEDLFFTDGIHDDLLTQLAKIGNLKVISRTSVMTYRDTNKRIPEIAADLGVGIVLEGGVQRAGDRIRVNAQLIDVATDQHLWAETFDREMTIENIFDIQSEISRQIVSAIKGEVSDEEIQSLSDRPTDSLAAWEAYVRTQNILRETDYELSKFYRAEPLIQTALRADPEFAEAWVVLAEIQMQGIWMGFNNTRAQRELIRDTIDRAIALDPDNPYVIASQAEYEYRVNLDYQRSLALIDQAIALVPGEVSFYHHRGLALRRMGEFEAAIGAFQQALELDPLDSYAAATMAETLRDMMDWERLEPLLDHWMAIYPTSHDLINFKVDLLIQKYGDIQGAEAVLARVGDTEGTRSQLTFSTLAPFTRNWEAMIAGEDNAEDQPFLAVIDQTRAFRLGKAYALKGDEESARQYLEEYVAASQMEEALGAIAKSQRAINLAEAHMWLGDREQAVRYARLAAETLPPSEDALFGGWAEKREILVLAWAGERDEALERIAARIDQPLGYSRWELYLNPMWDFFRDDPRFNDLARPEGVEPEPFRAQRIGDGT